MARVIISGLPQLKKKLADYSKKVQEEAKLQVLDSATMIEMNAQNKAPIGIKGLIDKVAKNNGFASEIGVQSKVTEREFERPLSQLFGPIAFTLK